MFDKYFEELKKDSEKKEEIKVEYSTLVEEQGKTIYELKDIDDMPEKNIYTYMKDNIKILLKDLYICKDYDFVKNCSSYNISSTTANLIHSIALKLLISPKFLSVLTQVLIEVQLNYDETVYINEIVYNYLTKQDNDDYLHKLILMLGEAINKPIVNKLLGCELDQGLAIFLAVTYKSTFNETINVKRVNFTLCTSSNKILSVQDLVNIYIQLYRLSFSKLFLGTMFDLTITQAESEEQLWLNDKIMKINDNITMAVIYILESMTPFNITKTLIQYGEEFRLSCNYDKSKVRHSLHELDKTIFKKVPIIIEQLEEDETHNLIIP